jgi:glycosyltransferase involved in cell wall biosynthesis
LAQLLLNIEKLGCDVYFLHIRESGDDDGSMRRHYGNRHFWLPYNRPAALPAPAELTVDALMPRCPFDDNFVYLQSIDDVYDSSLDEPIRAIAGELAPDVVVVEYVFFSKALECFGAETLKLIDAQDIFADRHLMFWKHGFEATWYSTRPAEEVKGLERADVILAIQEEERSYFAARTGRKVLTVGHPVRPSGPPAGRRTGEGTILFVGSENPSNRHGLESFLRDTFPLVRAERPDARLLVAGQVSVNAELAGVEGCTVLGLVDDLEELYGRAEVVINPTPFGTGLNVKNLEALAASKPLVTTAAGARGITAGAGKAFLMADSPEEFAGAVCALLSDKKLARRMARNAYRFMERYNRTALSAIAQAFSNC